jgi:phage tail protein X
VSVKQYITIQGDMWDSIAKKTLGSEYFLTDLIDANPKYREVVIFSANVQLTIPDIKAIENVDNMNLPPWKRGDHA